MKNIKKNLVKYIINIASFFLKNIKYTSKKTLVKVNLGCGLTCLSGWINIDGSLTALFGSKHLSFLNKILYKLAGSSDYFSFEKYNNIIRTCNLKFYDLSKKIPIKDDYANYMYCSHFLEHLTKYDGNNFLKECYRSMKKGATLRISVPDLDYAFGLYQKNQIEDMMDIFFFTSNDWDFAAHKYGYNFIHLQEILTKIGFTNIQKKSYQIGECPDINMLDVYPEHSLFVECQK